MRSRRLWTVGSAGVANGAACASNVLVVDENKSNRSHREPINLLLTNPDTIPASGRGYSSFGEGPIDFAA